MGKNHSISGVVYFFLVKTKISQAQGPCSNISVLSYFSSFFRIRQKFYSVLQWITGSVVLGMGLNLSFYSLFLLKTGGF